MTAVLLNIEVLWNVTPCSWLESYRRLEVSCCVYLENKVTAKRDRKTVRMKTYTTVLKNVEEYLFSDLRPDSSTKLSGILEHSIRSQRTYFISCPT